MEVIGTTPQEMVGITPNGGDRDRTDDPLLAKQVLSQLSYTPTSPAIRVTKREPPNGGPGRI